LLRLPNGELLDETLEVPREILTKAPKEILTKVLKTGDLSPSGTS